MATSSRRQLDEILPEFLASDFEISAEDESCSSEEYLETTTSANEARTQPTNSNVSLTREDPCEVIHDDKAGVIFTFFLYFSLV